MSQPSPTRTHKQTDPSIRVVGIVASAGGPEAVIQVLAHLPADFPVPLLLLQHLGRTSQLVEILRRQTPLAVHWANDGDVLRPATVWVAPPHSSLQAHPDGTLSLLKVDDVVKRDKAGSGWPSADQFFTSLAFSYGCHALAIVLTGAGRSGAVGVQEVKRQGGMVLAQDEATSSYWGMPQAAIKTGCVDLVLPLPQIAPALVSIAYNRSMASSLSGPAPQLACSERDAPMRSPWLVWSMRGHIYK